MRSTVCYTEHAIYVFHHGWEYMIAYSTLTRSWSIKVSKVFSFASVNQPGRERAFGTPIERNWAEQCKTYEKTIQALTKECAKSERERGKHKKMAETLALENERLHKKLEEIKVITYR